MTPVAAAQECGIYSGNLCDGWYYYIAVPAGTKVKVCARGTTGGNYGITITLEDGEWRAGNDYLC